MLQPTFIRTYIPAILKLHIKLGYDYPPGPTTLLSWAMQGISHLPNTECTRLPITMPLQRRLCCGISSPHLRSPQDKSMLHATLTLTLGFHGFPRCGELVNLTRDDITLAADLTDQEVCLVRAIQQYLFLNSQSSHAQPFTNRSGEALSKQDISKEIHNLLPLCRVACPDEYVTHAL